MHDKKEGGKKLSLKPRTCQILNYLIDQQDPVAIKDLADKFEVSPRTIRYDLDDIKDSLSSYELSLVRKTRVGVYLQGEEAELNKVRRELIDIHSFERILSPQERQRLILFRLFQANEAIIIKELELMLQISKSTIIKDLNEVEKWLAKHNLELIRKTNYGLEICGAEIDFRHAMTNILEETADETELIDFLRQIQNKALKTRNLNPGFFTEFDKLISGIDLNKVESVISFAEKQLGFQFADGAYAGLLVHLSLAISRLLEGKDIHLPAERLKLLKKSNEYNIAEKIGSIVEQLFEIKVPDSEIGYISLHLMGAKLWQKVEGDNYSNFNENDLDPELIILTREMVKIAEDYLGLELVDDVQLIIGLALHLKPTINRIKYDLPLKNPLLLDIKNRYKKIYKAAEKAAKILQSELQKDITADEIAYIALHFGAAFERKKSTGANKSLRVVLVCSSGMGTSNLLASRLRKEFSEIKISNILSVLQLESGEVDFANIDLIITTIPIDIKGCEVLEVNPLLSQKDKEKIRKIINDQKEVLKDNYDFEEAENYSFNIQELIEVIEEEAIIGDKNVLKESLEDFFEYKGINVYDDLKTKQDTKENIDEDLLKLLTIDNISIVEEVDDWKKGISLIGEVLLNQGYIKESYIMQTIKIIEDKGAYVVIAPHISLVHARPEDGVIAKSIGLAVIKEGVKFGHDYDPVHLIFILAPEDKTSHLPALSGLLKLLNRNNFVEEILAVNTKEAVIKKIKELL